MFIRRAINKLQPKIIFEVCATQVLMVRNLVSLQNATILGKKILKKKKLKRDKDRESQAKERERERERQ